MSESSRNRQDKVGLIICLGFLLFGVFVLIPIFPPFGFLWCAILGSSMAAIGKKTKEERGAAQTDWESLKRTGREAGVKYLRHVKAEDAAEQPFHSHDPVGYSYDQCAVDKRLEQLEVLREAGLLDDGEYKTRRQEILDMSLSRR